MASGVPSASRREVNFRSLGLKTNTAAGLLPVTVDLKRRPVVGRGHVDFLVLARLALHLNGTPEELELGGAQRLGLGFAVP